MASTAEDQSYRGSGAHHRPYGRPCNRSRPIDQLWRWLEADLAHRNQLGLSEPLKLVLGITVSAGLASSVTIVHNRPRITVLASLARLAIILHITLSAYYICSYNAAGLCSYAHIALLGYAAITLLTYCICQHCTAVICAYNAAGICAYRHITLTVYAATGMQRY
jgi:hypothetical protein